MLPLAYGHLLDLIDDDQSRPIVELSMLALFTALILLMSFTPLGYLKTVGVEISFLMVPVAAGAVLLGPVGGMILGAVFAGNFSTIFYSAAGGALAILTTIALKKILRKNQLWVAGCLGAMAHSIGQMVMAMLLLGTPSVVIYLPVMIIISIITGLFTGLCAQYLVNRGYLWKTISK